MRTLKSARRQRISAGDLPLRGQQDHLEQHLPEILGHGYSSIYPLDQDLQLIDTRYQPLHDLAVLSRIDQHEPRLVLTLGLQGRSRFVGRRGEEVTFNAGYATVTTFVSSDGERHYEGNKSIRQLRFSVGKRWLERYFGDQQFAAAFAKNGIQTLSYRLIAPETLMVVAQLYRDENHSVGTRLSMHAQALSILAAELSPLCAKYEQETEQVNLRDMVIANAARDILCREFQNPPSVYALSRRVGTNQFKLKQLFHQFFNNTPYGVLLDIRMHNALRLLQSTRCQVSAAAEFAGYGHAANFSAAFTKYFGVSPKTVVKGENAGTSELHAVQRFFRDEKKTRPTREE